MSRFLAEESGLRGEIRKKWAQKDSGGGRGRGQGCFGNSELTFENVQVVLCHCRKSQQQKGRKCGSFTRSNSQHNGEFNGMCGALVLYAFVLPILYVIVELYA